jgi:hypothetical protein
VRWTGDAAIAELKRLIDQVPDLKGQTAGSAEHTRWVTAVRRILSDLFGPDSDFYRSFTALPWQRTGTIVVGGPMDPQASMNPAAAFAREHRRAYVEQLDGAAGLLQGAVDQLEHSGVPRRPGFRHRVEASIEEGITEGLRLGLRNGIIALITFLVGVVIGALTPLSEQLQRIVGQR